MKLKLDQAGHVVVADGKPVYVDQEGRETPFDAAATLQTISRLNAEAKGHREAKEAAERTLKAREAEPAGPDPAKSDLEARLASAEAQARDLQGRLDAETISAAFSRSRLIAERFALPADLVQARFQAAFRVEDGQVVAYGADGVRIAAAADASRPADFDEALTRLVETYAYKDHLLKGATAPGGGATHAVAGAPARRTLTRAEFETLPSAEQMRLAQETRIVD